MARYTNYSDEEKEIIEQLAKLRVDYLNKQSELLLKLKKRNVNAIRQMVGRRVSEISDKEE